MKLDDQSLEYLFGKKFSNSLIIPYDYHQAIPNRITFLKDLAKGKKVIHLGCLDHLPLIDDKISRGQWLHKELTESAALCVGVDINKETKEYVERKHGFTNIVLGDFTKTKLAELASTSWDYAILGEILEHIDNPVSYLEAIGRLYKGNISRIVITVPNAWTQTTMRMARRSAEVINSDHRYWFTPYTLAKVIVQSGMQVEDIYFASRVPLDTLQLVRSKILRMLGIEPRYDFTFASSIVAVATL
jgi:2-polyprenyl-3-methyl-5-hydroxy-6-metoxy-1,4-benzoquinol methylase